MRKGCRDWCSSCIHEQFLRPVSPRDVQFKGDDCSQTSGTRHLCAPHPPFVSLQPAQPKQMKGVVDPKATIPAGEGRVRNRSNSNRHRDRHRATVHAAGAAGVRAEGWVHNRMDMKDREAASVLLGFTAPPVSGCQVLEGGASGGMRRPAAQAPTAQHRYHRYVPVRAHIGCSCPLQLVCACMYMSQPGLFWYPATQASTRSTCCGCCADLCVGLLWCRWTRKGLLLQSSLPRLPKLHPPPPQATPWRTPQRQQARWQQEAQRQQRQALGQQQWMQAMQVGQAGRH